MLRVVQDISNYDLDVNVSVFETNIRVLGGLLSSHLPTWRPGTTLVAQWKAMGRALYDAPVRYHWDRRTVGDDGVLEEMD